MTWFAKAALAAALAAAAGAAWGQAADIRINDRDVYPESLSGASDGTLYIGSIKGIVFKAAPGADVAEPWVRPTPENGILSLLGVLTDEKAGTLWLCSSPSPFRNPPAVGTSSLVALDLKTGALKGSWPFPAPASACNDIAIDRDGTAFATDTPNGRILTLKPGAKALELLVQDDRLRGIDGIAFAGDGRLYVNIVSRGAMIRVDRGTDGKVSGLTELTLSQPIGGPDGLRPLGGNRFLQAEGNSGRITEVTIVGDRAEVKVLREGLNSPPGVAPARGAAYATEGKIGYLVDPKLKGQDPGPFVVRAIPIPKAP